ncbi:hypothetical protein A2U01_0076333, partial [Trifolium medium]|nr:hypothetical protein [Trifolium medium]
MSILMSLIIFGDFESSKISKRFSKFEIFNCLDFSKYCHF